MGWKFWRWIGLAFVAWQLITTGISAFTTPWTWTFDQDFFVFLVFAILFVIATWLRIWFKDGKAGIRDRLSMIKKAYEARPANPKRRIANIAIWILIATALTFAFSIMKR